MSLRLIFQDLIIEFESTDEFFNDPIVKSHQKILEREHRIQELYEQQCLFLIRQQRCINRIERDLGFSLNDDNAKIKLDQLSEIIQIPEVLYQYVA